MRISTMLTAAMLFTGCTLQSSAESPNEGRPASRMAGPSAADGLMIMPPGSAPPTENRIALANEAIRDCASTQCAQLRLDGTYVENFSRVARLNHIEELMISYTNFDDLPHVIHMQNLRKLHIGGTGVTDLSPFEDEDFPRLTLLHAQQLNVSDFSSLSYLHELEELALGYNRVGDLAYLANLTALRALNLTGARIESFDGLHRHPSIETLDLVDATLPLDLSTLLTMPRLKQMSISGYVPYSPSQIAVIDELRKRGVEISEELGMVVC